MHRSLCRLFVGFFWLLGTYAAAEDHFLIIGGGPSPFNNQISLESNVLFSHRVLDSLSEHEDGSSRRQTFFADGKIDKPDLQFRDPDLELSPAVLWMSRILGDEETIDYRYRNHEVEPVDGPTRKAFLKQAFFELAERLSEEDRLIVYVTAHGGSAESESYEYEYEYEGEYDLEAADESNPYDTTIALWPDDSLTVSEFVLWLNKFSPDVPVVMIMAQCHSGGFAHAIFHHADADHGLNPQLRAGFFSQRHDRAAAGCTPEVDERNYHEYSTYFWEAVGGVTRSGEPMDPPDFNGDGTVSLAEAHAHAIITSDTIDIPVTTLGAFLRQFSEIAPAEPGADDEKERGGIFAGLFGGGRTAGGKEQAEEKMSRPLGRELALSEVLQLARPEQKAIISQLASAMDVQQSASVADVRRRTEQMEEEVDAASQLWATAAMLVSSERESFAGSLAIEWPALRSRTFSPKMNRLTGSESKRFVEFVESHPQCDAYQQAKTRAGKLEKKMRRAQHEEAKMRRLLRTLENVLLEQNLPHHASAAQLEHFQRLMALQQQGLAPAGAARSGEKETGEESAEPEGI